MINEIVKKTIKTVRVYIDIYRPNIFENHLFLFDYEYEDKEIVKYQGYFKFIIADILEESDHVTEFHILNVRNNTKVVFSKDNFIDFMYKVFNMIIENEIKKGEESYILVNNLNNYYGLSIIMNKDEEKNKYSIINYNNTSSILNEKEFSFFIKNIHDYTRSECRKFTINMLSRIRHNSISNGQDSDDKAITKNY